MKILVLCGGESPERIVSLASGDAVALWLAEAGHDVMKYDPEYPGKYFRAHERMAPDEIGATAPTANSAGDYDPSTLKNLLNTLDDLQPDLVFPILHGGRGEDGTLQSVLDWIGMPYTGSGALASAIIMNKEATRVMIHAAGVPVARGFVVPEDRMDDSEWAAAEIKNTFGLPAVVKPLNGGSTIGLTKIYSMDELSPALEIVSEQDDIAIIEEHFTGREIAATVVDGEAYPLIEIRPKEGFYDYTNKYTSGRTEYIVPAPLPDRVTKQLQKASEAAFRAVNCAGFARIDFLCAENGEFICLEINSLPGMTRNSLVPKAARAKGEEPSVLMQKIVDCALRKQRATV